MPSVSNGIFPAVLLETLLGIDSNIVKKIPPLQRYALVQTFDFLTQPPKFTRLICNEFAVNGITYYGYKEDFFDTTWEEFMHADNFFMEGNYEAAIITLYRQEREKYTGEEDRRIPFSLYGLDKRATTIKEIDDNLLACLVLNYSGLRQTYIVESYPNIFTQSASAASAESTFSWQKVHRNFLGENFFKEDEILKTKLHTVLNRISDLLRKDKK